MKISILTLFPEMFTGPFDHSIIKRAREKGLVEIEFINIRDFGIGVHKMVDDTPYGGGVGMIMRVDVLHEAIKYAKSSVILSDRRESKDLIPQITSEAKIPPRTSFGRDDNNTKVVLMSASGKPFKQNSAKQYAKLDHLILICGHYEGVDERIMEYIDEEVSIGDFVLTGGELPAMLIADSVTRLLEGAITKGAVEDESFSNPDETLEYPHYTKPREYDGESVPEVLLSGNHKKIAEWRKEESFKKTKRVRPELLK